MVTECEAPADREAWLELNNGATRVPVYFTLREIEGEVVGYLRLAHGQGNLVNRLLGSTGQEGCLVSGESLSRPIRITSTEPGEAPGYLCSFTLANPPP